MTIAILSTHLLPTDPAHTAFSDLTHAWLEEFEHDFERCTGRPLRGGSGVIVASAVLLELHGRDARWQRFEVGAFERWIRQNAPDFSIALPSILGDVAAFTTFLARTGRLDPRRAMDAQERFCSLVLTPRLDAAQRIAATKRSRRRRRG